MTIITDLKDEPRPGTDIAISDLVRKLYVAQEGRCACCGEPMAAAPYKKTRRNGYTEEHVVPKSRGGKRTNNILLAHSHCNGKKGNREPTAEEVALLVAVYSRVARMK